MLTVKQRKTLEILRRFEADAISKTDEEIFKETSELDQKYGHDPTYAHNIDGVLTNIGKTKKSLCLLYHARNRLLRILLTTKEEFPAYNLGNALLAIGEIKCSNSFEELIRSRELREAREYFSLIPPGRSFPQANTNLANILEKYGRNYEAIQVYDKVLKKQPTFGMALGNKGKAILYYYNLMSAKDPDLLFQAAELLKTAIGEKNTIEQGGQKAVDSFRRELNILGSYLSHYQIKRPSQKRPLKSISRYQRFCMVKNLFLNSCFNCFRCARGFSDSLKPYFIDKPKINSDESSYRDSGYTRKTYYSIKTLNQIYEDFASARYIYFHASTAGFRHYDSITKYSSALDYCNNTLQYGLTKTTYIRLFNILDKIAHLVYTNYEIGPEKVYFYNMKSAQIVDLVSKKKSWSLLALHSLAWDFLENEIYHHLSQIRNYITHEFIDIGPFVDNGDDDDQYYIHHHLSENSLHAYLEDLFLLVKSALMYTMNALYQDYLEERKQGPPLLMPIYPQKQF